MNTIRIIIVLILLAAVGAGVGWWVWYAEHEADRSELTLFGNVQIREVAVAFDASGRIRDIFVEEGDAVEEGGRIAEMEADRFVHEADSVRARVESQRQIVAELVAGTRPEDIRKAKARLLAAEAHFNRAKLNKKRVSALAEKDAVARQSLDDAVAEYDTTEADVLLARAELDLAIAGPRKEDIEAAKAQLKQAEAESALAQWALSETKLVAPTAGVIRDRILEPGDMATPARPVLTLALTDPIWVRVFVEEPDLGRIKPGMPADVSTDSFPDKVYEGWVGFISPTAEFTPKTVQTEELRTKLVYEVRVFVKNPDGELRLGMPATVRISPGAANLPAKEDEEQKAPPVPSEPEIQQTDSPQAEPPRQEAPQSVPPQTETGGEAAPK